MAELPAALPPGSAIGILGTGQLGRMLAAAAARLGFRPLVYGPETDGPALQIAEAHPGSWEDAAALARFAQAADVVTAEFENVPDTVLAAVTPHAPVRPSPEAQGMAQDRLSEKTWFRKAGIPTARYLPVADEKGLEAAAGMLGCPAVLKTRRLGYDGKGQAILQAPEDGPAAWKAIGGAPAILESFVAFRREVSMIAARGVSGEIRAYDLTWNIHADHILKLSAAPAPEPPEFAEEARAIVTQILEGLDYVGVLGTEFFVTEEGGLLVNEIAPRVHNSGHWTLDACATSQFEQHIRAIAGWPLGDTARHSDAVMRNLLGPEAGDWARYAARGGMALHLYGKGEARPGRKMGHVTRLFPKGSLGSDGVMSAFADVEKPPH